MFILFADQSLSLLEKNFAQQIRDLFAQIFEDIGEVKFADTEAQLEAIAGELREHEDLLIVPIGTNSENIALESYACLLLTLNATYTSNHAHKNSIATIDLNPYFQTKAARQAASGWSVADIEPSGWTPTVEPPHISENSIRIRWPIWSHPTIRDLRRSNDGVEKSHSIDPSQIALDTQSEGSRELNGVIFATTLSEEISSSSIESLIGDFVSVFRHNPDAVLRVHIHPKHDSGYLESTVSTLKTTIGTHGGFTCRIVAIDATNSHAVPERLFAPASFYIPAEEGADYYEASGYFSAQIPIIVSSKSASLFDLSENYELTFSNTKSRETVFKNAFHIARTSPNGYSLLQRNAMDNSRSNFSYADKSEKIRRFFQKKEIFEKFPHADARRGREAELAKIIGIHDYVLSGWINPHVKTLARNFPISKSDIIVDVGTGGGGFSRFCSMHAGEVVFCDLDENALEMARANIAQVATCPTRGLLTTAEALDIEDEYADKVVCTEVLEHVDNPQKAMSELVRVGKPGSKYLISVPDAIAEYVQKDLAHPSYFEKPNHIRIFERSEFINLVEQSGLKIISHTTFGFFQFFTWAIFWLDDPILTTKWAELWKQMLETEDGKKTKESLDRAVGKSQYIIAEKTI